MFTNLSQCNLVHKASDKCAFILANCPDEEAGLIDYLSLYFCKLPHAKPVALIIFIAWLSMLFSTIGIAASDFLCINLGTISNILGMSESLAGVTFLAFGNGSADVFSTFAAFRTHSGSLAVGELIGAAGFISAVVAGSMALIRPFKVARKSFVRDVGFFLAASSFSMVFLADGRLVLWECCAMIGFYAFYVAFVVTQHRITTRKRQKRLRETAARLHHHIPQTQELHIDVTDEDEDAPAHERTNLLRATSGDDISQLENEGLPSWSLKDIDEDDETRDRYLAELRSNMRVKHAARGERRNTITPIRPSLIGALEFRAVLQSLEKSSAQGRANIHLRRYSDDAAARDADDAKSTQSGPEYMDGTNDVPSLIPPSHHGRGRAHTYDNTLDTTHLRLDTSVMRGLQVPSAVIETGTPSPSSSHAGPSSAKSPQPVQVLISPPGSSNASREPSPNPPKTRTPDHLAPPDGHDYFGQFGHFGPQRPPDQSLSPGSKSPRSNTLEVPRLNIPGADSGTISPGRYVSSPVTASPLSSRPPSIRLPPPSMSPDENSGAFFAAQAYNDEEDNCSEEVYAKHKWWPYQYLPPPETMVGTLFPTIYAWRKKSWQDKALGVAAAIPVFLLTITLPVVETEENGDGPQFTAIQTPASPRRMSLSAAPLLRSYESPQQTPHPHKASRTPIQEHAPTEGLIVGNTNTENLGPDAKNWNRWLVITQLFTAPFFVSSVIWANMEWPPRTLLIMTLSCLVFSLLCLLFVLLTTTPDTPPTYRPLLCFLGFLVAIAWISTIASEVVGVLKALGVIFSISDAILGLTIFAVGNSLGDLVADITVAKLGFPVMALSACFGGPMLNILLGIGVSGLFMTIHNATHKHAKHPGQPIKYRPYEIEVSNTLLISGITLLVTLLGLLIAVPLNKWRMDRKIGWALIALWIVSTTANVVVEAVGWGGDIWDSTSKGEPGWMHGQRARL